MNGTTAVIRRIGQAEGPTAIWIRRLLQKKPARVATVAIANRTARVVWAVMLREEEYRRPAMAWDPTRRDSAPFDLHGHGR